jgi:predicted metal-dependent phosphoesterase TrpH
MITKKAKIENNRNLPYHSSICLDLSELKRLETCEDICDTVYSKADVHIHSSYSDGTSSPESIVDTAAGKLQVIAITDHNRIKGAFKAKEYALKNNIKVDVVIGEEISTKNGHVIGLFLNRKIIPGKTASETIYEIHEQGGIAIAPHPFNLIKFNEKGYPPLSRILAGLDFDAIEVINNSNSFSIVFNAMASLANASLGFAQVGVSDAHTKEFIGKGYTQFAGNSAINLKMQIKNKTTTAHFDSYSVSEVASNLTQKIKSSYLYFLNRNTDNQ